MQGFYSLDVWESTKYPLPLFPRCGECGLHRKCKSPKMEVDGSGKTRTLIVGEAPGRTEDEYGRPFVGESGRLLEESLKRIGIDLREDCWITNSIRCRPPHNVMPKKAIDHCRPYLIDAVQTLRPDRVILLGGSAVRSLLQWVWRQDVSKTSPWLGWQIPCQQINAWICPNYHPAYLLRNGDAKGADVARIFFDRWLRRAFKKCGKPFDIVPDYKKEINVLFDEDIIIDRLNRYIDRGRAVAFDIETDGLKPDNKDMEIISIAFSDGEDTISFPWQYASVISKVKEILKSDIGKIGWNIKYESRWLLAKLGIRVRNWLWDGMLAAHTLDNRSGICSLKFQAFVNLGQPDYDSPLKPYMESKGSNAPNRLREVDINNLLIYNGMDALLTYKLAMIQSRKMGVAL